MIAIQPTVRHMRKFLYLNMETLLVSLFRSGPMMVYEAQ